jgi:hypothetical protein
MFINAPTRNQVLLMKKSAVAFGIVCLSLLFSVAKAYDLDRIGDIRCLLVGSQMTKSIDTNQKTFGTIIVMFYLGRLDNNFQESNLEKLIENEASKLSVEEIKIEADRCRKTLVAKGQLLQRIGNNLAFRDQLQKSTPSR